MAMALKRKKLTLAYDAWMSDQTEKTAPEKQADEFKDFRKRKIPTSGRKKPSLEKVEDTHHQRAVMHKESGKG
ncbi:MAG: hypothetical protein WAL56_24615 [Candidatus Sulfotelmatobacter sp.]